MSIFLFSCLRVGEAAPLCFRGARMAPSVESTLPVSHQHPCTPFPCVFNPHILLAVQSHRGAEQTKLESTAWVGNGLWAGDTTLHPREAGIQGQLPPSSATSTDHNPTPASIPHVPTVPPWVTPQLNRVPHSPGWTGSLICTSKDL